MTNKFFVYGSLKIGGYFADQFDEKRKECTKASIKGFNLYNLGAFPAIVKGDGEVYGELHTFSKDDVKSVTARFDMIEGFYEEDKKQSLYIRESMNVVTENGKIEKANIYIFNDDLTDYKDKIIKSGKYELP